MKYKILKYSWLIGALALTGCNDWLDVNPKSQVKQEALFSSESGYQDALTGIYTIMASRKNFKKAIASVMGELFVEAMVCKMYMPGVDGEKADALMSRILDFQADLITRVSHTDGKDNRALVRKYYKELRADLEKEVEAVMAEIGELSKTKEA